MKRMHVHVGVAEISSSISFYSRMFGCEPTVLKSDYAKWQLEDPKVNFAISARGGPIGINHLGSSFNVVKSNGYIEWTKNNK